MRERERLRRSNPAAYRRMLEIERTAKAVWGCDGKEAGNRYLAVMLNPSLCNEKAIPRPSCIGRTNAIDRVEDLFLSPEALFTFKELVEKTSLRRPTLRGILCRMRQRGLVSYAQGSSHKSPILCHPRHRLALQEEGKKEKR